MHLRDTIAGAIVLVFGTTVFIAAGSYAAAAALFPRSVAGIMMLAATVLIVRDLAGRAPAFVSEFDRAAALRIAMVVVASLIYVAGVASIGFVTASVVFIPATAFLLGVRNVWEVAIATVVFVGGIAFLFRHVFGIPLPREVILALFN
jgi:hypothetical protein